MADMDAIDWQEVMADMDAIDWQKDRAGVNVPYGPRLSRASSLPSLGPTPGSMVPNDESVIDTLVETLKVLGGQHDALGRIWVALEAWENGAGETGPAGPDGSRPLPVGVTSCVREVRGLAGENLNDLHGLEERLTMLIRRVGRL